MSRLITLLVGVGIGAVVAKQLLEPRRRHRLVGKTKGAVARHTPRVPGSHRVDDADDVSLARKVETEIFRAHDAPKGHVSVDVQAGIVYLRGAVADDAWIQRLADDAKKVDGIKGVKNLLHRPGTPAPAAEPRGAIHDRI